MKNFYFALKRATKNRLNLIVSLLLLPACNYCMESDRAEKKPKLENITIQSINEQNLNQLKKLPKDLKHEIYKQIFINLIKDFMESKDWNKAEYFFKELSIHIKNNKEFFNTVKKYIPTQKPNEFPLYSGESLFTIAIINGWQNLWELILDNIKVPQKEKNIALKWFAIYKNLPMVERLLKIGANYYEAYLNLYLFRDVRLFNVIEGLKENKLPAINIDDALAELTFSKYSQEYIDEIQYFILNGANVNKTRWYSVTPLIDATLHGQENTAKLLLSHPDIDVNSQDYDGLTALIYAIENIKYNKPNSEKIARLLLSHPKINPNIEHRCPPKEGTTAIELAATIRDENVVKLLLNYSNDKNIKNIDKAYNIALKNKNYKIAEIIKNHSDKRQKYY